MFDSETTRELIVLRDSVTGNGSNASTLQMPSKETFDSGVSSRPTIDTAPPLASPVDVENRDARRPTGALKDRLNRDIFDVGAADSMQQRPQKVIVKKKPKTAELAATENDSLCDALPHASRDLKENGEQEAFDSSDEVETEAADHNSVTLMEAQRAVLMAKMTDGLHCFSQTGNIEHLLALFQSLIAKCNIAGDK